METNIKKRSVGSPIQAVLDSTEALIRENDLKPEKIDRITVRMSDKESHVVDKRKMPAINLQHLLAVFVLDQGITFISSHDRERMNDPAVVEFRDKVKLIPDPEVPRRQPIVEIATRDGQSISHSTSAVRGTPDNAMEREEVERKALDLIEPVLGSGKSRNLIDTIWTLERVKNLRELRPLLMV